MEARRDRCYVIGGPAIWAFRFVNTAFGSKWCGVWTGEGKLLDYWAVAFEIDGKKNWLGPETAKRFLYTPAAAEHGFEFPGLEVIEKLAIAEGSKLKVKLIFRNLENRTKEVKLFLELGLNFRKSWENCSKEVYVTKVEAQQTVFSARSGDVAVGHRLPTKFSEVAYKEHFPGNYVNALGWERFDEKPQRCGVTTGISQISIGSGRTASFEFVFSDPAAPKTTTEPIVNPFNLPVDVDSLVKHLDLFRSSKEGGFIAGYPYFLDCWTRDLCWVLPSYASLGMKDEVKRALAALVKHQNSEGVIPNKLTSPPDYASVDSTPLWATALVRYCQMFGDEEFLREMQPALQEALRLADKWDVDGDGLIEADRGSGLEPFAHPTTWMDSIERSGKPAEVQAIWAAALAEAAGALKAIGMESGHLAKRAHALKSLLNKTLLAEGVLTDRLDQKGQPTGRSSNVAFALALGQLDAENAGKAMTAIGQECMGAYGVLSWSKNDPVFNPDSYHQGAGWGLLTSLFSLGAFKYGRPDAGTAAFERMLKNVGLRCVNGIDEIYTSTGPQGAVSQAWSEALVPRIIDEGMLGLEPRGLERKITVAPNLPNWGFLRRKLFPCGPISLEVVQTARSVWKLGISNPNRLAITFVPPAGTKHLAINGTALAVNCHEFKSPRLDIRWS